ncbi:MAG: hypothetical protein ACP5NI_05975 [Acetobacteraceae bacterium]
MFGKDSDTRWQDTIRYLNNNFPPHRLGDHIERVVPQNRRSEISKELSLGSRPDGKDDPQYGNNTQKRHALRALLLCQRVYYSDQFWAKQSEAGPGLNVIPLPGLLAPNWKTQSLGFWGTKSEQQIQDGIAMFVPRNGATRQDLQVAAHLGAPNGVSLPGNLRISRSDAGTPGFGVICYVGVQGWLVKSGIVSMRWFMMNSSPNKQAGCDLLFGQGQEVWRGPVRPADHDRLNNIIAKIGPGYVVHIWSPENYNWNGHWVITNGDGTICGVNNGEIPTRIPPVQKNYTNHSTLFEQFEDYGGQSENGNWRNGVMVVIDPLTMPNRM